MKPEKIKKTEKKQALGEQKYNHRAIEKKWQTKWLEAKIYEPDIEKAKKPFYNLMMFPYSSAEGLHVGNMYAFCGSDIYGRFKRMNGMDVFEPIGLDGFGIHSENYALKIEKHPADLAKQTEANFYRQLRSTGNGYDWFHKLETYKSNYYKWTQWIFVQLFKAGLAYRAEAEVNWCPNCLTVLADEQVVSKRQEAIGVCERCETKVEKRQLSQWFFKTTAYAQRLLDGLGRIDWSEKVKVAQRNWIGKSEGIEIVFPCDIERNKIIRVFTTRPDTIFGVTFMALAPEHPLVPVIINKSKGLLRQRIQKYVDDSIKRTSEDRLKRAKSGVFSGFYCQNPLSKNKISIYITDYVLTTYGTGAVMGVPAHDQRDWEFARKYKIDIVEVIEGGDISRSAFTEEGRLVNSGQFNGLNSIDAIKIITKYIISHHLGSSAVTWHLRDWIISRQRYWGPPIPMVYCQKCAEEGKSWFSTKEAEQFTGPVKKISNSAHEMRGWYPVPEEELPVELPYIKNFKPTGISSTDSTGSPQANSGQVGMGPLANHPEFYKVSCPECGVQARRETDVSDTFLDSAWYFLRYPSVQPTGPVSRFPPASARSDQKSYSDTQDSPELRAVRSPSTTATRNQQFPWNAQITRCWLPVDMYIGGAEHSVLHLLYSRFLWKVFYDLGYFDFSAKSPKGQLGGPAKMPASDWEEPFTKFRAHGLLISKGAKMSKSKGNIISPDEYIEKYGADTLRCYLMFCGRFDQGGDFTDTGIGGMSRFLKRVWKLVVNAGPVRIFPSATRLSPDSLQMMHKTIKKVTEDIENLNYNTAIAALMEWMNALEARVHSSQFIVHSKSVNREQITRNEVETLLLLLAPFAPHITEELWQQLCAGDSKFKSIHLHPWPKYDPKLAKSSQIVLVIEVNGKVRDKIEVPRGISQKEAEKLALTSAKVTKYLSGEKPKKVIFVPDRLINFVI